MSLLLNALKKAEEGEKQDGQSPAPESDAQASAAPESASAPAAPAARPGGLAGGGGLSLKKTEAAPAPAPSLEAADAESDAEAAGEEKARTTAARIFRGGAPGQGEESASPFRAARNFLVAAALLAIVGGGGYFTLDAGFIPGVSVQSVLQLVGLQPPPPPSVAGTRSPVTFEIDQGAVLRLPRPAIDVQNEIDFVLDSPEADTSRRDSQALQIGVLVDNFREERRAEIERERLERAAQELPEEEALDLEGVVIPEEDLQAEGESPTAQDVLSDEVFTAAESRAEKARIESMTPSDDHIHIISASQKVALMMEMEAEKAEKEKMEMEAKAMESAAEAAAEEGEVASEGAEVAQAESDAPAAPAPAPEEAPMEEKEMAMEKEEMVAPSMRGEERRVALERAKGFYLAGRLEAAEAAYRAVLRRDANNLDALRGIAQIAVASGRRQLATTMYLRILDLYPRDPVSVAELANLQEGGDPQAMERMIRDSLGKLPEADARLYFALGNLYAGRELWAEAQQAYFEAVTLEEDNPDYTYNLAVVLDYLNRPLLAARYYRRAVELAEDSPSGFNLARTRARIQDLEQ